MVEAPAGPLHAFLAGVGRDGRGRLVADVLGFSDSELEDVHDYILHSLRLLVGPARARAFHKAILDLHAAGGAPVNARSLRYWAEAAGSTTL
jgi:hypothetical protein